MCGKMRRSDFLLGVIAVFLTLEEMKNYLRVDHEEDDGLLADFLKASEKLCMDIARMEDRQEFEQSPNAKIVVQYAVAYQYEHREEADHHAYTDSTGFTFWGEKAGILRWMSHF